MNGTSLPVIRQLAACAGQSGTGIYWLTGHHDHVGASGQHCLRLRLEDGTGAITAFAWPEVQVAITLPPEPSAPMEISGRVQLFQDTPQLKLTAARPVALGRLPSVVSLWPQPWCPPIARQALARLGHLEAELPQPLRGFLQRVLLDVRLFPSFLTCRASVRHHHPYPGGLLVHSTELLDVTALLIRQVLPDDPVSSCLGQLGYFLHDLGKLQSVGTVHRGRYGLVVRHEMRTIELLAPHLAWLDAQDLAMATGLRKILEFLAIPAAARRRCDYFPAELVAMLDQVSAAAANQRDLDHLLNRSAPTRRAPADRHLPAPTFH